MPTGVEHVIPPGKLAEASFHGDFQLAPAGRSSRSRLRVTNLVLPLTPGPYVLADGGGERFGGNTFLARNANTSGQFLFLITEGGPGGGVGAHFHARHFENFFALDGETLGWAQGKAVPLKTGDYFQAPPRNLHGFKLTQAYNRSRPSSRPESSRAFSLEVVPARTVKAPAPAEPGPAGSGGNAERRDAAAGVEAARVVEAPTCSGHFR